MKLFDFIQIEYSKFELEKQVVSELRVDNTRGGKLVVNLDLTVAGLPCNYFSIDAMDLTGDRADAEHQLFKVRMKDGEEVALSEKVEEINADKLHDKKQGRIKVSFGKYSNLRIFFEFSLILSFKKTKSQKRKKLGWQLKKTSARAVMGPKLKIILAATLAKRFSRRTETRDGLLIRTPSSSPSVLTVRFLYPELEFLFIQNISILTKSFKKPKENPVEFMGILRSTAFLDLSKFLLEKLLSWMAASFMILEG